MVMEDDNEREQHTWEQLEAEQRQLETERHPHRMRSSCVNRHSEMTAVMKSSSDFILPVVVSPSACAHETS